MCACVFVTFERYIVCHVMQFLEQTREGNDNRQFINLFIHCFLVNELWGAVVLVELQKLVLNYKY